MSSDAVAVPAVAVTVALPAAYEEMFETEYGYGISCFPQVQKTRHNS
jgi:hypothetical protein